jgi:electron transfer flavoprotein alpha subunit
MISNIKNSSSVQSDTSSTNITPVSTNKAEQESYLHLYVIIEHEDGRFVPVSLEMLGEARRLMDKYNEKYLTDEKIVAIVLGNNVTKLCEELIYYGADAVIYAESPQLEHPINLIDTKVISYIATAKECVEKISPARSRNFKKPRYMFFAADNIGRHLSSTVLAELESGLASDINKLVIEDPEIRHEHKTKGQSIKYEKILEMYRPDFSGFLWTTILCLDNRNPAIQREYHPQACSIIPGVFQPMQRDTSRKGIIIEYVPPLSDKDYSKVKILSRKIVKSQIDFDSHKTIIGFGRGIKESPEENIKLIEELASELTAEIGISLPISKKPYAINEKLSSKYMIPDRVIGTSGRKVVPLLYIALGISGAMQHIAGMKESQFIIAVNPDESSPIRNECDIFIKGRIEDVVPILIEQLRKQKKAMIAR